MALDGVVGASCQKNAKKGAVEAEVADAEEGEDEVGDSGESHKAVEANEEVGKLFFVFAFKCFEALVVLVEDDEDIGEYKCSEAFVSGMKDKVPGVSAWRDDKIGKT